MKAKKAAPNGESRIAVNCVQWNLNLDYDRQFVTVDDKGRITLYEINEKGNPTMLT